MKKFYLLNSQNLNQFSIYNFINKLKKDSDDYVNSIELKYNDNYKNIKKKYGIKEWTKSIDKIYVNKSTITYQYEYPKEDRNSPDRNLSDGWGYFMVFKSIGWRLKDKLKNYFQNNEYQINKFFKLKVNGYFIRIRVLKIKS